jgi:hypothetical protein
MKNKAPSFFRVISTDYSSFLSFLFPVVFGVFTVYFFISGNESMRLFLFLAIGATILGVPYLIRRYGVITSVFRDGAQAQGEVMGIGFFRGRGSISYTYTFQGEKHKASNAVNRNSRTRGLSVGQKVMVMVDRNDPGRAFIRDIYL